MNPNSIVRFSFLVSPPMYVAMIWILTSTATTTPSVPDHVENLLFPIMGVLFLVTVFVVEPILSKNQIAKHGGYTKEVMIVRLAMYQSGAIYGMILSLLTYEIIYVLGFSLLVVLLTMLKAPAAEYSKK